MLLKKEKFLHQVKAFHYLCLFTFDLLTNALSKTLQNPMLDIAAASELVDATITSLHQYQSEDSLLYGRICIVGQ